MTARLAVLPDAPVPEAPFPLPALPQVGAILPAQPESGASVDVLRGAAGDVTVPALEAVRYAEKLAGPAPVVRALASEVHRARPPEVQALCIPGAVRFAA